MNSVMVDEFSNLTDEQIKYLLSRLCKEQKLRKEVVVVVVKIQRL